MIADPIAEQTVLSSIMRGDREVPSEILERVGPDHFGVPAHRVMFSVISSIAPCGVGELQQALEKSGQLQEAGGPAACLTVYDMAVSPERWKRYAERLDVMRCRRAVDSLGRKYMADAQDESLELSDLMQSVSEGINILDVGSTDDPIQANEIMPDVLDNMEKLCGSHGKRLHPPISMGRFDYLTQGLYPAYYVIAARPSVGKSSVLRQIVIEFCINQGRPMLVFTLEVGRQRFMQQLVQTVAGYGKYDLVDGDVDAKKIVEAARKVGQAPLFIQDKSGIAPQYIELVTKRMKRRHGIECVAVDYLQQISGGSKKARDSTVEQVSEASNAMQRIYKDLNIPVIALAQINREGAKHKGSDNRPKMEDLKGSGTIEQDADVIVLLHRYMRKNEDDTESFGDEAYFNMCKNRDGATGGWKMWFDGRLTWFNELDREGEVSDK